MDEFIQQLNAAGARYLLIGGQAMRLAGMPRYSMDWDFFIPPHDKEQAQRKRTRQSGVGAKAASAAQRFPFSISRRVAALASKAARISRHACG